eukprot:346937_1
MSDRFKSVVDWASRISNGSASTFVLCLQLQVDLSYGQTGRSQHVRIYASPGLEQVYGTSHLSSDLLRVSLVDLGLVSDDVVFVPEQRDVAPSSFSDRPGMASRNQDACRSYKQNMLKQASVSGDMIIYFAEMNTSSQYGMFHAFLGDKFPAGSDSVV